MELPAIGKDVRCYWQSKSLSSVQVKKSINFFDLDRKRKEKAEIEHKQLQKEIANSQKNVQL